MFKNVFSEFEFWFLTQQNISSMVWFFHQFKQKGVNSTSNHKNLDLNLGFNMQILNPKPFNNGLDLQYYKSYWILSNFVFLIFQ
jgi:hypothetical protein